MSSVLEKRGLTDADAEVFTELTGKLAAVERARYVQRCRGSLIDYSRFTMPDPERPNSVAHSRYEPAPFHFKMAEALEGVERGEIKQLIFVLGPRHGKSQLCTKNFAAWVAGKHPDWDLAVASYSDTMAQDFGADTRSILTGPAHRQVFPNYRLRRGGSAKDNIQSTDGGRLVFVGRGGALTGRGMNCFVGETLVSTPGGDRQISDLSLGDMVLSYDQQRSELVWRAVTGFARRSGARIFRLATASGRMVETTSEHLFYVDGEWREARELTPGDSLLCAVRKARATQGMRGSEASAKRAGDSVHYVSQACSLFRRERDTVRAIEDSGRDAVVYDIEVEGAHCFFANGVLAHNCGICDDLFKDHEEARSQAIRDQAWNWFTKVFMTRRMGPKLVLIVMTRWHSDDIIGRITDPQNPHYNAIEAAKWKIVRLPAIAEENDPMGRKPGEALWPERFDLEFLQSQQRLDPLGFAGLYQQWPTVADGTQFRRETIQYYRTADLPESLSYYCASDHAVGEKQRNDLSCLLKVGVDKQDNIYLLDCDWRRMAADALVEAILGMAGGARKPIFWWAERDHISKSIGPFLRKRMQETQTWINLIEVAPIGDKAQRAQSIAGRIAQGKVFFPKDAAWTERAIDELMSFPNGLHDDFVDALAHIGQGLGSQFKPGGAPKKAEEPEFGTITWVKRQEKWRQTRNRAVRLGGF